MNKALYHSNFVVKYITTNHGELQFQKEKTSETIKSYLTRIISKSIFPECAEKYQLVILSFLVPADLLGPPDLPAGFGTFRAKSFSNSETSNSCPLR
jgi:hypothetical protein